MKNTLIFSIILIVFVNLNLKAQTNILDGKYEITRYMEIRTNGDTLVDMREENHTLGFHLSYQFGEDSTVLYHYYTGTSIFPSNEKKRSGNYSITGTQLTIKFENDNDIYSDTFHFEIISNFKNELVTRDKTTIIHLKKRE